MTRSFHKYLILERRNGAITSLQNQLLMSIFASRVLERFSQPGNSSVFNPIV